METVEQLLNMGGVDVRQPDKADFGADVSLIVRSVVGIGDCPYRILHIKKLDSAGRWMEQQIPLRHRIGRTGPDLLFQRVVPGPDLPLGKRQCNKTLLLSG